MMPTGIGEGKSLLGLLLQMPIPPQNALTDKSRNNILLAYLGILWLSQVDT